MHDPLLQIDGLSKAYGEITVLHPLSLSLAAGEILGLIGENGAGKSTLTRCLNGMTRPTSGSVLLDGRPLVCHSPADALAAGIVTMPQEFNLIDDLKVYENIFLGREWRRPRSCLLDRAGMRQAAAGLLAQLDCPLSPDAPVRRLSVAEKQQVEIAKALSQNCRLLILDEPTTVLNAREADILFALLRRLRQEGTALIFISHKLKEVSELCDRVAVLRDGLLVGQWRRQELSLQAMANAMVGRDFTRFFPPLRTPPPGAATLLEAAALCSADRRVRDVSFSLKEGEILGVAGLVGAGRTELAECLYGLRPLASGSLRLAGEPCAFRHPSEAVAAGIVYLSEDRQGKGILTDFPLAANVTLSSLPRYAHPLIDRQAESDRSRHYIDAFRIRCAGEQAVLRQMSGGNQQKVAIAKGLDCRPRLFIFDEPTRGIDIHAKSDIYDFIHALLQEGIACLLISSDLEEILGLCPKVAVMREGMLAGILSGDDRREETIMYLATGVAHA